MVQTSTLATPDGTSEIVFVLAALFIALSSVGVVLLRNPVRATLLLTVSFVFTSIVYVLLHAPFVGILQVLVYAGAIMMLFTFVVMMINPQPGGGEILGELNRPNATGRRTDWITALVLGGAGVLIIPRLRTIADALETSPAPVETFGSIQSVGLMVFSNPFENPFTLSFELLSFLILVGIIAALSFSRRSKEGER